MQYLEYETSYTYLAPACEIFHLYQSVNSILHPILQKGSDKFLITKGQVIRHMSFAMKFVDGLDS